MRCGVLAPGIRQVRQRKNKILSLLDRNPKQVRGFVSTMWKLRPSRDHRREPRPRSPPTERSASLRSS